MISDAIHPTASVTVAPASAPLLGRLRLEGDKSITHRALFFGALNHGTTTIVSPSRAADCRSTLNLLRDVGYRIDEEGDRWILGGGGADPSGARDVVLDCGNSGTTARLALGFLSGERGRFTLTGDSSLQARPMERVAAPLRDLGAGITTTNGGLPASVGSSERLAGSERTIEVASAQVHAALVLAALRSEQGVRMRRTADMRDHTRRIVAAFGAPMETYGEIDVIRPTRIDRDVEVTIPGDISSAAFFVCAALLVPGSSLTIEGVGLNPSRTEFLRALKLMGADLEWEILEDRMEPVGTISVRYGARLRALDLSDAGISAGVPVAGMIDELPLLALMGAVATGSTIVRGAGELRVKESDRIAATLQLLESLGLQATEYDDGFEITGPQRIRGGGAIDHHGDHRLCMLAAVAALAAAEPVVVPDPDVAAVSYPGFWQELARLAGV